MTEEDVLQLIEDYEKEFYELDLSNRKLALLPSNIGMLKNLTKLNLSENHLTQLPNEIGEINKLIVFNLSMNQLKQLPSEIGELKNLTEINLSNNYLMELPPEIGELKNLNEINLSNNWLTELPPEIGKLKNLKKINLFNNYLKKLPSEIGGLENLTILNLSRNNLKELPQDIGELKNLTKLDLSENHLTELPSEIGKLEKLKEINLNENQLTNLPLEIRELKNLNNIYLARNMFTQFPSEIIELENLTEINLSRNDLIKLPPKIRELKNLTKLDLFDNKLIILPPEIGELKNLVKLDLFDNKLMQVPSEIGKLENLTEINLNKNLLTHLPSEIKELRKLNTLYLSNNQLTQLPIEILELENLRSISLYGNPLVSPPPQIVSLGLEAILTYLKQTKPTENNEAKLILVGNGDVGKTCLAHRLIYDAFLPNSQATKGINISKWVIPALDSGHKDIRLNVWDFGGQEIYHATHQFFLTMRSVYLLIWNARKTKDYDNIYYWLHTIEAFGGDSPIILVMSKMNEINDDLNLKDLINKFPQITDYLKVDSEDGKGFSVLKEKISEKAWNLPLMRTQWDVSWYKVRERLERLGVNWITYDEYYNICVSEGLDHKNIGILDGYLHELGVTLHFKDNILKNIVILKPEWATNAFYQILSSTSVLDNEGVLPFSELDQIWDRNAYPPSIHYQLMELMNKFELLYELPDESSYLIPELLKKEEPKNFEWDEKDNLCFYYCYDYFLPLGIITRFIVRMHRDLEISEENRLPLCWREGAVLKLYKSRALVKMNPDEKQIEIRIKGYNKRWALQIICYHLDHINASIKKIKFSKQIPCKCSENCPERYVYDKLLNAEMSNVKAVQCHESFKSISISSLLDGYKEREERVSMFDFDVFICHSSEDKSIITTLIDDLKMEEITCWVDYEQIKPGDSITQKIEEGLNKSKYILACLSKNLNFSGWARAEYGAILNAKFSGKTKKNVIPLKLDNCDDDDIPQLLRDIEKVTYSNKIELCEFIRFLKG